MSKGVLIGIAVAIAAIGSAAVLTTQNKTRTNIGVPTVTEVQSSTSTRETLDATDKNPGASLNPADKGRTVQSDLVRYTLLDVREDTVGQEYGGGKVYLVKLMAENISAVEDLSLSVAEVDLVKDKPTADRVSEDNLHYTPDVFYPREKMGVDLASDVSTGKFTPGTKVVGYYSYTNDKPLTSLYFSVRNFDPDAVGEDTFLKVIGSFRIK